jgi:hypothetical protein
VGSFDANALQFRSWFLLIDELLIAEALFGNQQAEDDDTNRTDANSTMRDTVHVKQETNLSFLTLSLVLIVDRRAG